MTFSWGGEGNWDDEISVNGEDWERLRFKISPTSSVKILTEGAVMTEAGSLFQYFATPTKKADRLFFGGGSYLGVP